MFVLNSDITIGPYKRVKPHQVKIDKSMFTYVDKAVIKLPITARIVQAGEVITKSMETAKAFAEGDKVLIKLGYNGVLKTEFDGFISRVNFTSPLEVECEGYSYQLRKRTYLKTFKNVELVEVLRYLVAGTDIVLDEANIPAFKIDKLVLQNHSGTEALDLIKKIGSQDGIQVIQIFFTGYMLYAGLQYLKTKADVKYRLGWNVIKDNNLKQRQAKNAEVTVHYIGEKKDGSNVKVAIKNKTQTAVIKTNGQAGISGEEKVIKTHSVTDESSLTQMAEKFHSKMTYDGYEGKITAFGVPYCEPGYRAVLDDQKYVERSGNYIVESTEVTYGTSGFRRIVGIGAKL